MNDVFKRNLSSLETHHKLIYNSLKSEIEFFESHPFGDNNETYHFVSSDDSSPNLVYLREEPTYRKLYHSKENPWREAEEVLQSVDLRNPQSLFVFGMGLGYLLKSFLKIRQPTNFSLLVIEKNPQIFLRALCVFDFSREFEDKTIGWSVQREVPQARLAISNFFAANNTVSRLMKILATPTALQSENAFYEEMAKNILEARDFSVFQVGTSVPDSWRGFENTLKNFAITLNNPGILGLRNRFAGKVCVSVAAGPSVNDHWETIKYLQGKVPLFVCDTLLKPCHDREIAPDFVTAIERDPVVTDFFKDIPIHPRTTLIAPSLLLPESFEAFKGRTLVYAPGLPYVHYLGLNILGEFFPGSSAGNLNIALAAFMGFSTVIMIGHNLAFGYKTHETHARGTIDPERERKRNAKELENESRGEKTLTQDGSDQVWTKMEWNLFRSQIENCIAGHPKVEFINTALKGARIGGSKTLTLNEALDQYVKQDFDIFPAFSEWLTHLQMPSPKERYSKALEGAERALASLRHWSSRGLYILEKLESWKRLIHQGEEHQKPVSLDFLNQALDETLAIKVEACNEDLAFGQAAMPILLPAHSVFERTINSLFPHYTTDYDLKRDFLLKHTQYFEIWDYWLPQIIKKLEEFIHMLTENKTQLLSDESKTEVEKNSDLSLSIN